MNRHHIAHPTTSAPLRLRVRIRTMKATIGVRFRSAAKLLILFLVILVGAGQAQQKAKKGKAAQANAENSKDARNTPTGKAAQPRDPEFAKYGIYEQSAPRPAPTAPVATALPLDLKPGDHI